MLASDANRNFESGSNRGCNTCYNRKLKDSNITITCSYEKRLKWNVKACNECRKLATTKDVYETLQKEE